MTHPIPIALTLDLLEALVWRAVGWVWSAFTEAER